MWYLVNENFISFPLYCFLLILDFKRCNLVIGKTTISSSRVLIIRDCFTVAFHFVKNMPLELIWFYLMGVCVLFVKPVLELLFTAAYWKHFILYNYTFEGSSNGVNHVRKFAFFPVKVVCCTVYFCCGKDKKRGLWIKLMVNFIFFLISFFAIHLLTTFHA